MIMKSRYSIIIILIIILLVSFFSSCFKTDNIPIDKYFNYLRKLEYPRIYGMLTKDSKKKISLDDMCVRYENIYSALAVESMTYDLVSIDYINNVCYVFFILNIKSAKLGEFILNMSAVFIKEKNTWKLKWEPSLLLSGMVEGDLVRIISNPAERGEIFSSDGRILAQNAVATTIYVDIDKIQNAETLIRVISPILKMEESDIRNKLEPYYKKLEKSFEDTNDDTAQEYSTESNLIILKAFSKNQYPAQDEIDKLLTIPGLGIDDDYMTKIRYYPNGNILAHTIGYVGFMNIDEAALSENITLPADTMIGKSGLEKKYEMQLRSQPGYKLTIIDKYGHEKQIVAEKTGQNGADLRLNIDLDLQIKAELLLMENLTSEMSGAVVILDPVTGAVKSLASFPSYDPNLFSFSLTDEQWEFLNDPINRNPLYNRVLSGLYPPGSIFKPFTASIALETNSITKNYIFKGKIEENIWIPSNPEWVYPGITRFSKTPGDLNLSNAIVYSDNIYFAYSALQVGRPKFYEYCKKLGMDEAIPFDLGLSSPKISNTDNIADIKLLADSGYGQGELLITPLQMASLFSVFAYNGDLMQPQLIN